MSMEHVAAFETADIAVMSGGQLDALFSASPLVLDLDGNGVRTRAAAEGIHFDLAATGNSSARVGWLGQGDALLVRDRNGDGQINDGRELYGVGTHNAQGQRMGNGFAALALEDSNHDGRIDARDESFKDIKLWVDANHDGKTDAGELRGLADSGVVELNLAHVAGSKTDQGNLLGLVGSYRTADGATHEMSDVWFAKQRDGTTGAAPPLAELVSSPSADLLGGAGGAGASPAPAATSGTVTAGIVPRNWGDDETRNHLLL
jgi:trimeric autotransporter adhesin